MRETNTQTHHIHLFKGVVKPKEEFAEIREADHVDGIGWRLVVLSIISGIFGVLTSYVLSAKFGLTSVVQDSFQQAGLEITDQAITKFGMVIGGIAGLFVPIITMLVMAAIFLIFFRDVGYKKMFAIELYLQVITIVGSAVSLLLMFVFQTANATLSLGAITRLFTDQGYLSNIFSGITIFLIWKLFVQINAIQNASNKSMSYVMWILIILNIVFLLLFSGGSSDPNSTFPM